jgi:iron complex transport system substrate-binding protein
MILGIWWLGNLLYPELYDYDMVQVAQEIYKLFWNYDLSVEEASAMLANSTLKRDGLSG